jgi:HEPN domain-containing protein
MATRHEDWMKQARRDFQHAKNSLEGEDYEWSCFAAQQSAEKAVKALFQKLGADAWGHSITMLLSNLPESVKTTPELVDKAKELDDHYITSRYPNSYPCGAPFQYYTKAKSERAIQYADEIIRFCEDNVSG